MTDQTNNVPLPSEYFSALRQAKQLVKQQFDHAIQVLEGALRDKNADIERLRRELDEAIAMQAAVAADIDERRQVWKCVEELFTVSVKSLTDDMAKLYFAEPKPVEKQSATPSLDFGGVVVVSLRNVPENRCQHLTSWVADKVADIYGRIAVPAKAWGKCHKSTYSCDKHDCRGRHEAIEWRAGVNISWPLNR